MKTECGANDQTLLSRCFLSNELLKCTVSMVQHLATKLRRFLLDDVASFILRNVFKDFHFNNTTNRAIAGALSRASLLLEN